MEALKDARHNSIHARTVQADLADKSMQCPPERFLDGDTVVQCQQVQELYDEVYSNGTTHLSPVDLIISMTDQRVVTGGDECQPRRDCEDIQRSKHTIIAFVDESSKAAETKGDFAPNRYDGEGIIDAEQWKIRETELINRIRLLENENKEKRDELEFAYDTINEGYETIECLVEEKNTKESTLQSLRSEMAELISKLEKEDEVESQHNGEESKEGVLTPGGNREKLHQEGNVHTVSSQDIDLMSKELHQAQKALEKSEKKVIQLEEEKDRIWKAHKASHEVLNKKLAIANKSRSAVELELKRKISCLKESYQTSFEALEQREASIKRHSENIEKECEGSTQVFKDGTVLVQTQNASVLNADIHLQQSLSWKENRSCEKNIPYERIREENKTISDRNRALSKEIDFLLRDVESYKSRLQEAEATARRLEDEKANNYSSHQAAMKRTQNGAENIRGSLSARESELEKISIEVSKSHATKENDDTTKAPESNLLNKAQKEKSTFAEQHMQQQEELMALKEERSALQKEILELKEALDQTRQNVLNREQEDRMHDIEAIQNENRILKDRNTALERENDAISHDLERLDTSLKKSATEMQRLEEQNDCLVRESQESYYEVMYELKETQTSKSVTEAELRNHISSLEDYKRISGETIGERDATIVALERKLLEACKEKSSAFLELAAHKNNLDGVISENKTLKEQVQSIQKELDSVACELSTSQSTAETLAEGIEHMHEENQRALVTLKKELDDAKKVSKLNMKNSRDLQLAQKKCSSQGDKILQQECDIWNLRKEKNALKEQNQILIEKMNELESTGGGCRNDLSDSVPSEQNTKHTAQGTKEDKSHTNDLDFLKLLNEMNTLAQHNVSLTEKVNSLERSLDDCRTSLKESESLVARLKKEKTDIQEESHSLIHYLRKDLEEANRRWVGMSVENEHSALISRDVNREELMMLRRINDELQQEVLISAKRVDAQGKDLKLLINDLKNARSANERLRAQVADLKKRLSTSE